MRRFALVALIGPAVAMIFVGDVAAAEMSLPPQYPPPPQPAIFYSPPPFSWTGFYIGGNLGWAWTRFSELLKLPAGTGSLDVTDNGFLGGGQVGFNWQPIDFFILGAEADFQGTTERSSFHGTAGPVLITVNPSMPYFGTVRGRVGFAYDRIMVYVTGGGVFGENVVNGTVSTTGKFSASQTYSSWTFGGGIEASLGGHFTAKLEYLYIQSPNSVPLLPGVATVPGNGSTSVARAGVNYHF